MAYFFHHRQSNIFESNPLELLIAVRKTAIDQLPNSSTIAPRPIVKFLIDSFFILLAFKSSIEHYLAVKIIGENAAFPALIARERAIKSDWPKEAETYCNAITEIHPLKTIEYIVKPGDTLSFIIRNNYELTFNLLWPLISVVNPEITDPNYIKVGQRISLPEISAELPIFRK